jgi:hypothetical protein
MRKILAAVVVALVVFAAPAFAQEAFSGGRGSFPGCPTCGVWSWVDLPGPEATVSASDFAVQGWGFECFTGKPIIRVDVWYQDYDGNWWPLPQQDGTLAVRGSRPDVQGFAPTVGCAMPTDLTGWTLTITNPPPAGLRRMRFVIWRGPYREIHQRTYLIIF